jgi:hypothetical protein
VIGALGGAVLGSAIAGHGDRTAGAVIGGVGGAVVGNQLAGSSVRCPQGYYRRDDRPVAQYDRGAYGYGPGPNGFWRGAPLDIREREDWLAQRIERGVAAGTLDRREARRARDGLRDIRVTEQNLRSRDGGRLYDRDRDYIQMRLDTLSQQIRWANETGPRRY